MERYDGETHINVGTGTDVTIRELATRVAHVVGFGGDFASDATKPDGPPRKLLAVRQPRSPGWSAVTPPHTRLPPTGTDFRPRSAPGIPPPTTHQPSPHPQNTKT